MAEGLLVKRRLWQPDYPPYVSYHDCFPLATVLIAIIEMKLNGLVTRNRIIPTHAVFGSGYIHYIPYRNLILIT